MRWASSLEVVVAALGGQEDVAVAAVAVGAT